MVVLEELYELVSGIIYMDNKFYLYIVMSNGYVDVQELQIFGKRCMVVKDFLNGWDFVVDVL